MPAQVSLRAVAGVSGRSPERGLVRREHACETKEEKQACSFVCLALVQWLGIFDCLSYGLRGLAQLWTVLQLCLDACHTQLHSVSHMCFKMFRNSSFLGFRLQEIEVTRAALSCLWFAADVFPHVS